MLPFGPQEVSHRRADIVIFAVYTSAGAVSVHRVFEFSQMANPHHEHGKSDLKVGLLGLSAGLVWIAIVGTLAYFLAMA
jgi:hypothetical protein